MKPKRILVIATIGLASFAASALGAELSEKASALPEELRQGLVLYYSFDSEPSAKEIADESGEGNDGKIVNVEWIKDGHQGGAANFGLTDSYITVPNRTKLNPPVLTLSAWIKTSCKDDAWRRIFDKGSTEGYTLTMGGGPVEKNWQGEVCVEAGKSVVFSGIQVTDGTWHHIVGTFDGEEAKIYVDGMIAQTKRWKGESGKTSYNLTIGSNLSRPAKEFGPSFNGTMDDVMMFNRALSDDEVQTLFKTQGGVADEFVNPASLKVNYIGEKSAKLCPKGFQPLTRNSNKSFAVMDADDPSAVLLAKPVYFDLRTGSEIHYAVESEKPLTKLIYTGVAFKDFFIGIYDENGSLLTSVGPYNYGNAQKTLGIPLPNVTRFKVVVKTAPMIWLLIKEIHFVSGPTMPADEVQELLKSATKVSDSNSKAPVSVSPDKTLTLGQDVTMSLKLIPAGKFFMGGKSKNSEVTISKPFYLAATEVTRQQFEAFVSQTGYQTDAEKRGWATYWDKPTKGNKQIPGRDWRNCGYQQEADHPVACVTWNDAHEFCQWLAKKTGEPVRLPTEAEWEYACRAGTTTRYQWGNDPQGGKGWCNITDESLQQALQNAVPLGLTSDIAVCPWSDGYAFTSPSGQFKANAWGLFDMHGNLWEWCADRFQQDFYSSDNSIDPRGPNRGALRVIRGGCWGDQPGLCSSAARVGWEPTFADFGIGFRVCCGELAPVQPVPTGGKSGSADRLKQLKQLLDQGLINKEDYDRKMKEIVDSI